LQNASADAAIHLVADRGDGGGRGGRGDGGGGGGGRHGGGGGGGGGDWHGGGGGNWHGGWDGGHRGNWGRSGFYFGISPYRYGYNYGYGYPGYSYGNSWPYSGYSSGYYSTPSYGYSYAQPSYDYVQPSYSTDGGYSTGYWQGAAANPPANAEPVRSRVVNPAENQATLRYSVNGRQYSIQPGEQHDFTEPGLGVIEFDRGNNAGLAQYRLSGGVYTFSPTDRGWELFRSQGDMATAGRAPGATR
jgi:hypothetical protein